MSVVVVSYIYLCFFALIFVVLCSQLVALVTAMYYSLVVVVVGVRTHLIFMSRTHFFSRWEFVFVVVILL